MNFGGEQGVNRPRILGTRPAVDTFAEDAAVGDPAEQLGGQQDVVDLVGFGAAVCAVATLPVEVGVRADIDKVGVLDERTECGAVGGVVQVAEDRDVVVLS